MAEPIENHALPFGPRECEPPVAAFLLELCGVLYDDSCWRRWMLQLLTRMGVQTQYTAFYQTWEELYFPAVCAGEVSYFDAMRSFLRSIGLSHGRVDEACAAGQSRRRQWEQTIRPLPGVADTVRTLHSQGIPLAVVAHSSFDHGTALRKLRELRLSQYVGNGALATADLGQAGRFQCRFQIAADVLGLPSSRIAYVGCGRLPLTQASADGLRCYAYNTDAHDLPCESLRSFRQLTRLVSQGDASNQRRAG